MGFDFAVGRVPVAKLSKGNVEKMLAEGAPWRELILSRLDVVAHPLLWLSPREQVAAERAGSGKSRSSGWRPLGSTRSRAIMWIGWRRSEGR